MGGFRGFEECGRGRQLEVEGRLEVLGILSVFFGSEGGEEGFGKGAILSVFDSGDCVRGRGGLKVSGLSRSEEFFWVFFFARVS